MKLFLAVLVSGLVGLAIALLMYLPALDSQGTAEINQVGVTPSGTNEGSPGSEQGVSGQSGGTGWPAAGPAEDIGASRRSAIVRAAEHVGPAVVSITVIQTRVVSASPRFRDPFFEQFFRDHFGARRRVQRVPSLGSGVILTRDGLVVTNEHVVRDGTDIKVTLTDGRQFDADLIASQQDYDLALLRINGTNLPFAELGSSGDLIIGEWAIAIGNPFGYLLEDTHPTVTVGVISALNRNIKTSEDVTGVYTGMIQTDAAINPGNSGGALVNSLGQLIGINTFIITKSGGSMGIGFAIPVSRVQVILDEVKQYGRIREIWIGLLVQEMTPLIAHSLGIESTDGVIVSQVDAGSPAAKAGLKRGDVIVEVNGGHIRDFESARRAIFGARVGDVLEFMIVREGDERTIRVDVEEAPIE
ncbi:MAG: trypsin-like peptidase domain-containing protein [Candidatus Eisenbacteria bacterium]